MLRRYLRSQTSSSRLSSLSPSSLGLRFCSTTTSVVLSKNENQKNKKIEKNPKNILKQFDHKMRTIPKWPQFYSLLLSSIVNGKKDDAIDISNKMIDEAERFSSCGNNENNNENNENEIISGNSRSGAGGAASSSSGISQMQRTAVEETAVVEDKGCA